MAVALVPDGSQGTNVFCSDHNVSCANSSTALSCEAGLCSAPIPVPPSRNQMQTNLKSWQMQTNLKWAEKEMH